MEEATVVEEMVVVDSVVVAVAETVLRVVVVHT